MRALVISISLCLLWAISAQAEVSPLAPALPPPTPEVGLKAVVAVAENYLKALSAGDWGTGYDNLSSLMKNSVSKEAWSSGAQEINGNAPASGSEAALMRLLPGAKTCRVSDVAVDGNQGKALLEATYDLPMAVNLVKEGLVWKVDLLPADREIVTEAANQFAEHLKTGAPSWGMDSADRERLLFPYITSRQVDDVELEPTRAKVTFLQTATVLAVLRLEKQGPFWMIAPPPLPAVALAPATVAGPAAPVTTATPPAAAAPAAPAPAEAPKPAPEPLPGPHHWRE
jgi:hypothetical protein